MGVGLWEGGNEGEVVILFLFRLVVLRHDPSEPSNLKEKEEGMDKEEGSEEREEKSIR